MTFSALDSELTGPLFATARDARRVCRRGADFGDAEGRSGTGAGRGGRRAGTEGARRGNRQDQAGRPRHGGARRPHRRRRRSDDPVREGGRGEASRRAATRPPQGRHQPGHRRHGAGAPDGRRLRPDRRRPRGDPRRAGGDGQGASQDARRRTDLRPAWRADHLRLCRRRLAGGNRRGRGRPPDGARARAGREPRRTGRHPVGARRPRAPRSPRLMPERWALAWHRPRPTRCAAASRQPARGWR